MKYFIIICMIILLSGCATVSGHYEKREGFRYFGLLSEYKKVPERYIDGGAGSIETPDGVKSSRTKRGSLIDVGSILSSTQPTTEVK